MFCCSCGKPLNSLVDANGDDPCPEPGDITCCLSCGTAYVITAKMELEFMNEEAERAAKMAYPIDMMRIAFLRQGIQARNKLN